MPFRSEVYLDGGVYFQGDADSPDAERTDFSMEGAGTGTEGNPYTLTLHVTTGNATVAICGITVGDIRRLGRWIAQTALDKGIELERGQIT